MHTMISPDKAEFMALWVETLLYGLYLSYFLSSIGLLTWNRSNVRINWVLIFVSLGMFVLASTHLIIVLNRSLQAFIEKRNAPGGPTAYFSNLQSALEVCQASSQVAISVLGDGMVIYRVWVVYNRNYWVLILPALSFIGTTASSIASVVFIGKASSKETPFYLPSLETWLPAFFALTFATSVLCSLLIAGRLVYIRKRLRINRTMDTLTTVLRIVIESASIYSLTMLIYLIAYTAKSNVHIIFGDMVSPVIGIAFSLITIRVHNAFNPDNYNSDDFGSSPANIENSRRCKLRRFDWDRYGFSRARHGQGQTFPVSVGPLSDPYPLTLEDSMRCYTDGCRSGTEGTDGGRGVEEIECSAGKVEEGLKEK